MQSEVVSSFFTTETKDIEDDNPSFSNPKCVQVSENICDKFLHIVDELNICLEEFKYPSAVECVYNPTLYARYTFELYVRKYCNTTKPIMYFGMNPGPWGMSQTGVPFGEISSVRDWLGIKGPVGKPLKELTARPVKGFDCTRTEISGKRFWGLFRELCGSPDKFFTTSFVYNYIPQQWMKGNGCNLTPGDFKLSQMEQLFATCDPALVRVLQLYAVRTVVAVGLFCETRAKKAIQKHLSGSDIKIVYLPHPSPRSKNNNDWEQKARQCLKAHDLLQHYQTTDTT